MDLFIPEKLCQRHWDGDQNVMETGESRYGKEHLKIPAIQKDCTSISAGFTIMLVRDINSKVWGTAGIIRAETERWKQEKELRQKIKLFEEKSNAR